MNKPRITVVGGGFGGFHTTRRLLKKGFKVLLVSDTDFFTFSPLLTEVATGSLCVDDISFKYKDYFKSPNFEFLLGRVTQANFDANELIVNGKTLHYEYLALAPGSVSRAIDPVWKLYTLTLKNVNQAVSIREAVVREAKRDRVSHINIIGAGATGIELVFGIKQLLDRTKKKHKTNMQLFEYRDRLCSSVKDPVRQYMEKMLKKKSIITQTSTSVSSVSDDSISIGDKSFPSDLTIMATGVIPNTSMVSKNFLNDQGNIIVNEYLQVEGKDNVFALGDPIVMGVTPIPDLAQTASDQAKIVASNISSLVAKKPLKKYRLSLKGQIISLGEGRAIGNVYGFVIKGRFAHWLHLMLYIAKIPSFKNKLHFIKSWTLGVVKVCLPTE